MKNYFEKHKKTLLLSCIVLASVIISACGDGSTLLQGAAGQPTETESSFPSSTEASIESPTATPFPAASGRIIFVSNRDGQNNLYITSADGSQVERLTTNIAEDTTPRISPDGTRVAYVSTVNNNTDIYVIDINTRAITQVTNAPEKDSSPTWSPDSRQLAFESFRDGNFEIYITNVDGSNQYRLTNDPAADTHPVWSPTSNEIAFVSNRFGNADILLANTSGTLFTLTTNPAADNGPAWSPDGSTIAFQAFSGDLSNLCLIGRDGLNLRCVTSSPAQYTPPTWSPDGVWIASSGNSEIHLFNILDGSTNQLYTTGIEPRSAPYFSRDGLRLVFQAQFNGDMELFSVLIPTNEFSQVTAFSGYDGEAIWIE
jgi:TolB protein